MIRRRTTTTSRPKPSHPLVAMDVAAEPLLPSANHSYAPYNTIENTPGEQATENTTTMSSRNSWLVYAVASGACAAFNGVFAKLYGILELF